MKKLLLAAAIGLAASPTHAGDVQGVYICNDTSDPIAWKVYCSSNHDPLAEREIAETWSGILPRSSESWQQAPAPTTRPGGLLRQPAFSTFTQEEWNASLGR